MKKSMKFVAAALLSALIVQFSQPLIAHASALGTWLFPAFICAVPETHTGTETHAGSVTFTGSVTPPISFYSTSTLTTAALTVTYGLTASTGAFTATGGAITASTSTTSQFHMYFAGAFASLPTSGYNEGSLAYQVSDHTLYVATATVTNVGHWKAAY